MNGIILNRISTLSKDLTKSQKALVEYLQSANINSIIYLSITELSDLTGVGEATILRFCRLLGFTGYQDFKLSLAREITDASGDADDSFPSVIYNNFVAALTAAKQVIDLAAIDSAVKCILSSRNISIFGAGNSYIPALELHNRLLKMSIYSLCESSSHMQNMAVSGFDSSDCLVLFSVTGCTKDIIDVAEIAKKNNVKIIVITSYDKSPLTKFADIVILSIRKESPVDAGSMLTKVVQLYIVDILSTGILLSNKDKAMKNIEKSQIAVVNKLV